MKHRLTQQSHQAAEHEQGQQTRASGEREFASAEEMLRWDAAQTAVPPALRERVLRDARKHESSRPWWKRWFS